MSQTKTETKSRFFSLTMINQAIFIIIIIMGIYYLTGANDLAVIGFKLRELKDQQNQLTKENQNLELSIMSMESYSNITSRVQDLKMVAAADVDYLSGSAAMVAKK